MLHLKKLNISECQSIDINVITTFQKLADLSIRNCNLSTLDFLSGTDVECLDISENEDIRYVAPLMGMKNLKYLCMMLCYNIEDGHIMDGSKWTCISRRTSSEVEAINTVPWSEFAEAPSIHRFVVCVCVCVCVCVHACN